MIASGRIDEVRVGQAARLDGSGKRTAYRKSPVTGRVVVAELGLAGDTQVERRYHGGPEKAVYAYPVSGHAGWAAEFPEIADRFHPGAMGENLVIAGLDEAGVHIGDVIRAGTALLQVSQLREPCATFAAALGTPQVVKAMARSGRCGWYCRVLEAGQVAAGDGHDVIERPNPGWSIARLAALAVDKRPDPAVLEELVHLPHVADYWRQWARKRLARHGGA